MVRTVVSGCCVVVACNVGTSFYLLYNIADNEDDGDDERVGVMHQFGDLVSQL